MELEVFADASAVEEDDTEITHEPGAFDDRVG
jgi:hypothetical protein